LSEDEAKNLKVTDFEFSHVDTKDQITNELIKHFITRHEWLGTMPNRPTHRFVATYNEIIAGVVIMSTPNAFSNFFGRENRNKEKLISRGACISWSPKNLGSALITYSIRWMVKNTDFRFFTAYSDTEARELGTIYQACNFIYLGKNSGARAKYFDPENPNLGWFTDRSFRQVSFYKRYANKLQIEWQGSWNNRNGMLWHNIPPLIEKLLRQQARANQKRCLRVKIAKKHKYLYILGKNKKETKKLKAEFFKKNPKHINLNYPKIRGE